MQESLYSRTLPAICQLYGIEEFRSDVPGFKDSEGSFYPSDGENFSEKHKINFNRLGRIPECASHIVWVND